MRGDEWREFDALSQLPIVNRAYWAKALDLIERARETRCQLPVRQLLAERPSCACSFRLAHAAATAPHILTPSLADIVRHGCAAHRHTLTLWHEPLSRALGALTQGEAEGEELERARSLALAFSKGHLPASFNYVDARLIERALPLVKFDEVEASPINLPPPPPTALPVIENEPIIEAEPIAGPEHWLDNLPGNPTALLDVMGESGRNAD